MTLEQLIEKLQAIKNEKPENKNLEVLRYDAEYGFYYSVSSPEVVNEDPEGWSFNQQKVDFVRV